MDHVRTMIVNCELYFLPIDSLESLTRNESADDDGVGGSSGW